MVISKTICIIIVFSDLSPSQCDDTFEMFLHSSDLIFQEEILKIANRNSLVGHKLKWVVRLADIHF